MKQRLKSSIGVEFSVEALVTLATQRFPNMLDWANLPFPEVDYDRSTETIGLYFTKWQKDEAEAATDVPFPLRRVSEGAPIPVVTVAMQDLLLGDGTSRCGYFADTSHDHPQRCVLALGHVEDHKSSLQQEAERG